MGFVLAQFSMMMALPLADAGLLFIFLLASGVTLITFTGFTIWAAYHAVRVFAAVLARMALTPRGGRIECASNPSAQPDPRSLACADPVCRTINPENARFCRQCGRMIRKTAHLAA